MKRKIFAVRDSKAEYFQEPVFALTRGEIIRSMETAVNDGSSPYSKHASDFAVFELGEFDQLTGQITVHPMPVHVVNAFELVRQAYEGPKAVLA